jgi:Asp-tRNA(Asn)/Glu-tRNA(Gln) amidotransferase C subunit
MENGQENSGFVEAGEMYYRIAMFFAFFALILIDLVFNSRSGALYRIIHMLNPFRSPPPERDKRKQEINDMMNMVESMNNITPDSRKLATKVLRLLSENEQNKNKQEVNDMMDVVENMDNITPDSRKLMMKILRSPSENEDKKTKHDNF